MEDLKEYILNQVLNKSLTPETAAIFLEEIESKSIPKNDQKTEFAVIGMACRFPGAETLKDFWENLIDGRDLIDAFPKERADDIKFVNQYAYDQYNGFQCRVGGYFERIDLFDHAFFKITPSEARVMDPGQRIFLEVAFEALENAGLTEENLKNSSTGIYVGYSVNEDNYFDILSKDDPNIALGNQASIMAYRLAFLYDMHGPTMVIDTACSSSLVAVHQACLAIEAGDCEQAIVGGVNIRIYPAIREIGNLGIEAFDGRCRSFDERANGTNISDGIAALIIKRRDLAEKDGDYIYAIIKGSAINSDGSANGITSPNPEAQAEVIKKAWKKAGIDPKELNFIEAHGTGTKLGDPIEILGLTQAFAEFTDKKCFCPLGAVKANIGHLESTSGLAGLIKVILCLQNRKLPKNIHYQKPNPYIDFENSPVFPATELITWDGYTKPLIAGVSSFGISGTNSHVVVKEYQKNEDDNDSKVTLNSPIFFFFSSKQEESLHSLLSKYYKWLKQEPNIKLHDLAFTLARARNHYDYRIAITATTWDELCEKLKHISEVESLKDDGPHGIFYNLKNFVEVPELIRLYLQKKLIFWKRFFPDGYGKKIPLPSYVFNHKRHWPKLEIQKADTLEERLHSVFYQLKWVEDQANYEHVQDRGKYFLFFMQNAEEHESFAKYIEKQGIELIRIYPSDHFELNGEQFYINPSEDEDYKKMIAAIDALQTKEFGGVIHLWDWLPVAPYDTWHDIITSQNKGAFSLFSLIKALPKKFFQSEWKCVNLTSCAQKIEEIQEEIDPTRMPALGINKVISQEFPLVRSLAIDVGNDQSDPISLFNEIFKMNGYKDSVICFRNNKRYVQLLAKKDIRSLPERPFTIRNNGVYLIAGGAGYLGLETAALLAKKAKVKIALSGRKNFNELSEKQKSKIEGIEKLGSEILYYQCDVTDNTSCSELIESVIKKWGSINGIFVAIKNISHQLLEEVSVECFTKNILAKIQGVWFLDKLTEKMPLDFMATFSSISSLTGGPTGADCCASNLFLDSFCAWRNDKGRTTINMNYTLIEADDGTLLSDRMSMIPPLTKEEFLGCLDICITKNIDFAVMADFNSHVMGMVLPFMKVRFSDDLVKQFRVKNQKNKSENTISSLTETNLNLIDIQNSLIQIWKDILGYDKITLKTNFFEIGGDSISAVKLLHLIKVQLLIEIEISDLYSYPVLEDLAKSIISQIGKHNDQNTIGQLLDDLESGKLDINQVAASL